MSFVRSLKKFKKLRTPKNIYAFILIIVLLIVIIYDSTLDETKHCCQDCVNVCKFENKDNDKKLELQINYLIQKQSSSTSWLDRKETNAWASFALYLTGLAILLNFLIKTVQIINWVNYSLILLFILSVAISVFAFIHAQYSSIYNTFANANASNNLILDIIDNGKPISNLKDCLDYHRHHALYKNQKFRGKGHPLKIVKYFVLFDWIQSDMEDRNLDNIHIQEATIYFLMIVFNIAFSFILINCIDKRNKHLICAIKT